MLNKRRLCVCALTVLAAGVVQGCDILNLVGTVEVPATIVFYGKPADITAPDTVTHGTSFQIAFQSSENGCGAQTGRERG